MTDVPAGADVPKRPHVWERPQRLGYQETLRGLGGVVAPLLTGFSLATIAVLVTSKDRPPLSDWAEAALAAAVGLLLYGMQCSFLALSRTPSPPDIVAWLPEATVDATALDDARAEQAANMADVKRLWKRTGLTYDLGLLSFLAGLLLLLIPHAWSAARIFGVGIAGLALFVEIWWTLANRIKPLPHPAVRDFKPGDFVEGLDPLDSVTAAAAFDPAKRQAAGL